jgi:hypothetical protein
VFEYIEGNHPRLQLYLESPAAKALAIAERTFPVFKGSEEIDGAPLMKPVILSYPFAEARRDRTVAFVPATISLTVFASVLALMCTAKRRARAT